MRLCIVLASMFMVSITGLAVAGEPSIGTLCGKPPLIENDTLVLKLKGEAQALFRSLGTVNLDAEFANARASIFAAPENLRYLAGMYLQYETCALVESSTDWTPKEKEKQIIEVYEKTRQIEQSAIDDCVNKEVARLEQRQTISAPEKPARAEGPGLKGGRKTATAVNCLTAPPGFMIAGPVNVIPGSCNEGRCSINQVTYSKDERGLVTKACVDISAWSESKSGGKGGWAGAALSGTALVPLADNRRTQIHQYCSGS